LRIFAMRLATGRVYAVSPIETPNPPDMEGALSRVRVASSGR
jgi:hypothetical protein